MAPFGPYAAGGTLEGSFASLALRSSEATAGDPATQQLSALFGQETVDACRQALEQIGTLPDPPAAGESPS